MSLSSVQRANLIWASRPPGPAGLWYGIGSVVRTIGRALDTFGAGVQGNAAHFERLPIPCTAVKVGDASPSVDNASASPPCHASLPR